MEILLLVTQVWQVNDEFTAKIFTRQKKYNSEIKISFAGSVSDSVCSLIKILLFGSVSMRVNPPIFSLCPYTK